MLIEHDAPTMIDELLSPYKARLLAEGDSWFSVGGWLNTSLLAEIARANPDWLIVSCATSGEEADTMAEVAEYGAYSWMLRSGDGVPPWDALLLSAGGNDLIAGIGHVIDAHGVRDDLLETALMRLKRNLLRLIDRAREIQPGIPVVLHTYDYIEPTTRSRLFRPGPWVGPQLAALGVNPLLWQTAVNLVVDHLGDVVDRVAAERERVRVVHSAGTLIPGDRRDWANEIHPSLAGYRQLAPLWQTAITHALAPAQAAA